VVWLAYTQGVARGRTETPILAAENGPARVAPQNPGGTEQPYKGFKIYEQPAPPDEDAAAASSAAASAPVPKPAPPKPAAKPVPPPPSIPAAAPKAAAAIPAPAKPPAAAPKVAAAAPIPAKTPVPVPASSTYALQIGAYKSQAEADAAWKSYKAKHATLLADAATDVQQADLGEKGIWYRLRITGFASKDVASSMCDRLKADGGACFLGH
jgi:cell division protein FtsN